MRSIKFTDRKPREVPAGYAVKAVDNYYNLMLTSRFIASLAGL
jgi:hypothetical protein